MATLAHDRHWVAMSRRQHLAIAAAPAVLLTMLPVYVSLTRVLPREWAWLMGFLIYWSVWCLTFPLVLLGPSRVFALFRRSRWHTGAALLALAPPLVALVGRFVPHGEAPSPLPATLLMPAACVMGVLEEVLWRGVYLELFPDNPRWSIVWPSLWFALWHFAPGLASPLDARVLVAGALVLGLTLGFIAQRTRSIRWTAAVHVLTGLVRVL